MTFEQEAEREARQLADLNDPMRRITVYNNPSFLQECAKEFLYAHLRTSPSTALSMMSPTGAEHLSKQAVMLATSLVEELRETMKK